MQLKQFSLPLKSVSAAEAEMNALLRTHLQGPCQRRRPTESWRDRIMGNQDGTIAGRTIKRGTAYRSRNLYETRAGARTFLSAIVCEPANGRTRVSNAARI